jgi:serine protease
MVAGTLGASVNNDGVSGVNWTNPLLNVRVLGKCGGALSDIADGIRWAAGLPVAGVPSNARPARVINLSFAGNGDCGPVLQAAVTDALAAGSVIVAAAGNNNDDVANHWPANCSGVIAVAATSKNASRAFYSNWGAAIAVGAPGGGIGGSIVTLRNTGTTTADPAGYVYGSQVGSSLAAPHVAGIASLALAVEPALTPAEIRALIESTARPFPNVSTDACTDATCGAGIADAAAALASISAAPVTPGPRPPDALPPINLTPQPPSEKSPPPPPDASTTPPPGADDVGGTRRAKSREELDRILKD